MPRKKRVWYPGAVYHVMSRGNRRDNIFREDEDYIEFLRFILKVQETYPFKIHALCLMTNHFHMIIETMDTDLSKIMHKLLLMYAANYNIKYHLSGHLFENRYVSSIIEDDVYFLEVSRYIHLNPVKAKMVREPLAYEYSSYRVYMRVSNTDCKTVTSEGNKIILGLICQIIDTSHILECFSNNPQEQYRMFVEGKISHAEKELMIQKDIKEDDMWLPW